MADKWSNGVITNAGISMLGEVMSGGELIISRAALGGGTVDVAALMAQTTLTQPLTAPVVIAQKKLVEGKGLDIRVQIRNTGVSTVQVMKQVGLFAKIGVGGEEKLLAIMQDDAGDEIPSAASYPDFMLEFTAAVAVSNTGNITVAISSSALVTEADLEAALDEATSEIAGLLESKANKGDVPTKVSDLVNDSGFIISADGGNADMLDGKHAGDFLQPIAISGVGLGFTAGQEVSVTELVNALADKFGNEAQVFAIVKWSDAEMCNITCNDGSMIAFNGGFIVGKVSHLTAWSCTRLVYYPANFTENTYGGYVIRTQASSMDSAQANISRISDGGNAASVGGASIQVNAQAIGLHQMFVGTADPASVTIPAGAWYGRHS